MISQNLLTKFNQVQMKKTILHIKDMEESKEYLILNAKKITTKYGPTIKIELETHIMFLPPRYNFLSDDDVNELSIGAYYITRDGEKSLTLKTLNETDFLLTNAQYPIWQ